MGVDKEGNVCIIEMKNTEVDADIIPQVLRYAFWAENNPDSIKSLWLQCEDKPDDIEINWDKLQVRILVIAPTIRRSTLDLVNRIAYPVDLIEVKRWVEGDNEFLLVNRLEPDAAGARKRPVSGARVYDEAFYKGERNSKGVDEFLRYARELEALVKKQGWNLETKFNRGYCGFKGGFFNAFGISWFGPRVSASLPRLQRQKLTVSSHGQAATPNDGRKPTILLSPARRKLRTCCRCSSTHTRNWLAKETCKAGPRLAFLQPRWRPRRGGAASYPPDRGTHQRGSQHADAASYQCPRIVCLSLADPATKSTTH